MAGYIKGTNRRMDAELHDFVDERFWSTNIETYF